MYMSDRVEEAKQQYETALLYEDDNPDIYYNVSTYNKTIHRNLICDVTCDVAYFNVHILIHSHVTYN